MRLIFDAEAFVALVDKHHPGQRLVRQALDAARRVGADAVAPALVLAELFRGTAREAAVDALLGREAIDISDTDKRLAREVGRILVAAGRGSDHIVDAHVVAVAARTGGVVLTGDPDDMVALTGTRPDITIEPIAGSGHRPRRRSRP